MDKNAIHYVWRVNVVGFWVVVVGTFLLGAALLLGSFFLPIPEAVAGKPAQQQLVLEGKYRYVGYRRMTGLSSVQTVPVVDGGQIATFWVEDQNVRWRGPGDTAPTPTVGVPCAAGDSFTYHATPGGVQIIEEAASAVVHVVYWSLR